MKKLNIRLFIFVIIGLGICLFLGQHLIKTQASTQMNEQLEAVDKPNFWVISDNHFLADELIEDSERFRAFEGTAVGTDIRYTSKVFKAFVEKALEERPTGIIMTGDVTLNGERESLKQLKDNLSLLKDAGIPVLAIPGNHDIYNGWARKFMNGQQITEHQITPQDFKKSFSDGYEYRVSSDTVSLSYAIDLKDYRMVMLDSNIYGDRFSKKEPITKGELKAETLEWLETVLEEAKSLNKTPLLFVHHNLLAHNAAITEGFVLNNADQVLQLVEKYQVPLAMTGHIHLQNIMQSPENPTFYEITSSAFSTAGNQIGHLTLEENQIHYEVHAFDPRPYFSKEALENPDLKNYPEYLEEKYRSVGEKITTDILANSAIENVPEIAQFVGEANLRYFTGNNQLSENEKQVIREDPRYAILKQVSPRLWRSVEESMADDNVPNNRELTIPIKQSN